MEWGVCMPDACSSKDVSKNFDFLFKNGTDNKSISLMQFYNRYKVILSILPYILYLLKLLHR